MTTEMQTRLVWLTAWIAVCTVVSNACATPIEFVHTGIASGTINVGPSPVSFTNAAFTVTASGDTANRTGAGSNYDMIASVASISIDGFGLFQIANEWHERVNNSQSRVEIFYGGDAQTKVVGPTALPLSTWNMLTSLGPISGTALAISGSGFKVTNGFFSAWTIAADSPATFQATVVPEPSTFALLALGGIFLHRVRRLC
jgi:hypothetical protein